MAYQHMAHPTYDTCHQLLHDMCTIMIHSQWNNRMLETLNPYSSHLKFNERWTHGSIKRCTCIIITICIYTYIVYTLIQRPRWMIRIISLGEYETNHVVRLAYMIDDAIITSAYMTCPYCLTSHGCSHECHVSV